LFCSHAEKTSQEQTVNGVLPDLGLVSLGRAQRVAHRASKILLRKFCRVSAKETARGVIRAVERIKEGGRNASGDDDSSLLQGGKSARHEGDQRKHQTAKADQHGRAPLVIAISDEIKLSPARPGRRDEGHP
jgi:hypothetical protein